MEIQGTNGFKTQLNPNTPFIMGRQNGPNPTDQSISRAHISLSLTTPTTVTFHVIGKNPVWVENNGKVKVFNGSEMGDLKDGDMFCVGFKHPVWFSVKKVGGESEGQDGNFDGVELSQSLESGIDGGEFELGCLDIDHFDPVKDFGFLVIGHEFDQYQKQINHEMRKWNWFLEDTRRESDDDDDEVPGKRGGERKRKKARDNDVDEEWTGESGDDEVAAVGTGKARKVQTPKYRTRSKDPAKKDGRSSKKTGRKDEEEEDEEEEDDDEDETLGGFIVDNDDGDDGDDDGDEMDEEEEEFVEDELDD